MLVNLPDDSPSRSPNMTYTSFGPGPQRHHGEDPAAVDLLFPRQDRRGTHAGLPRRGMDYAPGTCLGHSTVPEAPSNALHMVIRTIRRDNRRARRSSAI